MRVAKWGNSLGIRLPAELVAALSIREGDDIEIVARAKEQIEVTPDNRRKKALERMRSLRFKLPPGYKFNREEANARGPHGSSGRARQGTAAD